MVWFPNSWCYLARKKYTVAMCSCFKKSKKKKKIVTTRGLFISAMSHVKLIAETRVYICHKNMKFVGICFTVFRKFSRKKKCIYIYIKIFYRKWRMDWVWDSYNYKWLCTTYSLELISSLADKTTAPRKNEQYFYF